MKSIIALEKLIKILEQRISVSKSQLARDASGEEVLTLLVKSSIENSLDKNIPLLVRYKNMMKEFQKFEELESTENERLRMAIDRKKYYKYNRMGIEKKRVRSNDEKIEAVMIIGELPEEIELDNQELYQLTFKSIEKFLFLPENAESIISDIHINFNTSLEGFTDENIKSLEMINFLIPMVIFQFHILKINILEDKNKDIEDEEKLDIEDFICFPKYHDWWISELGESHKAHFCLYQWKNTINDLCITEEQKEAWEIIFNNWIFIKTLLAEKAESAFEYQFVFDNMLQEYTNLESELDEKTIEKTKEDIQEFITNEDCLSLPPEYNIETEYTKYKKNQ